MADDPRNPTQEGLALSPAFDSAAGTKHLAELTETPIDVTAIAEPAHASFPLVPAAILGALAFVALVLGVALAM